ncbi:hypothetical protein V8E54_013706, partial [Elaphomyces granulatus]
MKTTKLSLLALLLQVSSLDAKKYTSNVSAYDVGPDATITGNKIEYSDPDSPPSEGLTTKSCAAGMVPTLSADKKYFACCPEEQTLHGSPDTAFYCCASGHALVGSVEVGYCCCPTGHTFDGQCNPPVCQNGKKLVNGECVCPANTDDAGDGTCKPKPSCDSGLQTGKCYTFTSEDGKRLSLSSDGLYYTNNYYRYGKFQLCANEQCTSTAPTCINPSDK